MCIKMCGDVLTYFYLEKQQNIIWAGAPKLDFSPNYKFIQLVWGITDQPGKSEHAVLWEVLCERRLACITNNRGRLSKQKPIRWHNLTFVSFKRSWDIWWCLVGTAEILSNTELQRFFFIFKACGILWGAFVSSASKMNLSRLEQSKEVHLLKHIQS